METLSQAWALIIGLDAELMRIVALSLKVSLTAVLVASIFAIPFGAALAIWRFPGHGVLSLLVTSFMALPPVVVGLAVFLALSRAGPLGSWGLLYTPTAMIIAQTLLIFPIVAALSREGVAPLHRDYKSLFKALDISPLKALTTLLLDARFALFTALLAGFGRALAEVGAVLIVGGNINGQTRVMTTTIALETSKGNLETALALGLILILIAITTNLVIHTLARVGRVYQVAR